MKKLIFIILLILLIPSIVYGLIVVGSSINISPNLSIVTTNTATNVTGAGATLNGTAYNYNSAGTVYFNYGLTSAYGTQTSSVSFAANTSTTTFSENITGLTTATTYHFQACVNNNAGTICGGDLTFTPVGVARLTSFSSGVTSPSVIVIDAAKLNLYVASSTSVPRGIAMSLWDNGGSVYVSPNGSNDLTVKKIRLSDFTIIDTATVISPSSVAYYAFSTSNLGTYSFVSNVGGSNANSFHVVSAGSFDYVYNVNSTINGVFCVGASNGSANSCYNLTPGAAGVAFQGLSGSSSGYFIDPAGGTITKEVGGTNAGSLSLPNTLSSYNSATLDSGGTFYYAADSAALSKVDLSTFTITSSTTFAEVSPSVVANATPTCLSSVNYVYCARESYNGTSYNPSWITTIRKSDMVELAALVLNTGEAQLTMGAIDNTNNLMYMLSYNNNNIIKFAISP